MLLLTLLLLLVQMAAQEHLQLLAGLAAQAALQVTGLRETLVAMALAVAAVAVYQQTLLLFLQQVLAVLAVLEQNFP
jgi:hypothetical protein